MHRTLPASAALLLAALAAAPGAHAQPAAGQGAGQGVVTASYATYSHLLNVLNLEASIDLNPGGYGIKVVTHTAGTVRLFLRSDITTEVTGSFSGPPGTGTPHPVRYSSTGDMNGNPRVTLIEYRNGQPVVRTLTPPNAEDDRDDIPAAQTLGTVDTLSAMALLVRQVSATGRCEGTLTTFDGRRVAVLTARTAGPEVLDSTSRSSFAGPALRCDFEGHQTGGFKHDDDIQHEMRVQHGTAWFAQVAPGGPSIPVRITFENRILGEATMYIASPLPSR